MNDPSQLIDFEWYVPEEVFLVENPVPGQYAAVSRENQSYRLVPSDFDVGFMPKHKEHGEGVWAPDLKVEKIYNPFQKKVWESFIRLREKEDIVRFIKKYGFLTVEPQASHFQIPDSIKGRRIVETEEFWINEVKMFYATFECIDYFRIASDVVERAIAIIGLRRKILSLMDGVDVGYFDQRIENAYYYGLNVYFSQSSVKDFINPKFPLSKNERHSLPDIERHLRGALGALFSSRMDHLSPTFLPAPSGRLTVKFVPQTLLGVMWLQFVDDMQGAAFVKVCPVCSKRFVIHTNMHRDRKYCSDSCKVTAWKKSKKPGI